MLIFGLRSTSDDWLGWSMDLNPIHHPSPAKKIKCSFLDYVQLLIISRAGWWTWTLSATPLQPKKIKYVHLLMIFLDYVQPSAAFWWSDDQPGWARNPLQSRCLFLITFNLTLRWIQNPLPISSQKNKMLIFGLHLTSDDQPGRPIGSSPVHHPFPVKKIKCLFLDYVQLLMIG